jgi:hypothetical protein
MEICKYAPVHFKERLRVFLMLFMSMFTPSAFVQTCCASAVKAASVGQKSAVATPLDLNASALKGLVEVPVEPPVSRKVAAAFKYVSYTDLRDL